MSLCVPLKAALSEGCQFPSVPPVNPICLSCWPNIVAFQYSSLSVRSFGKPNSLSFLSAKNWSVLDIITHACISAPYSVGRDQGPAPATPGDPL